jgi:hypothetical protein
MSTHYCHRLGDQDLTDQETEDRRGISTCLSYTGTLQVVEPGLEPITLAGCSTPATSISHCLPSVNSDNINQCGYYTNGKDPC